MMTRTACLVAIVGVLLAGSARAAVAESTYWKLEGGSPAKVLDFVAHSDGNVYAVTHDMKVWKRYTDNGAWKDLADFPAGGSGTCPASARARNTALDPDTLPLIVSFKNKLYVAVGYNGARCAGHTPATAKAYTHTYPETCIFEIDTVTTIEDANHTNKHTPVATLRGPAIRSIDQHSSGATISAGSYDLSQMAFARGYLFKTANMDGPDSPAGTLLGWGGGGGEVYTAADEPNEQPGKASVTPLTDNAKTEKYIFTSANGTAWACNDGNGGKGRLEDQYGRRYGVAMPNGYRYSHIIYFNNALWDYYGYYDAGEPFTFTAKTDGIHTEPWSRFQMGAGTVLGVGSRLFRVGFDPDGQKNFIYAFPNGENKWYKFAGDDSSTENNKKIYWRGMTVVGNTLLTRVVVPPPPTVAPAAQDESKHNGLYATYSYANAAGTVYKSGVARYRDTDSPKWQRMVNTDDLDARGIAVANKEAAVFTGAIFFQKNDDDPPPVPPTNKGVILVGTSVGVIARRIGIWDIGPDKLPDTDDDISHPPQEDDEPLPCTPVP